MVMRFFKKIKEKRALESRRLEYAILLKKFYDKHNFIANYHIKMAKDRGDSVLWPKQKGTLDMQRRLKQFFVGDFASCPGSFDLFSTVSFGNPDFDPYPIEKLKNIYDKIETFFPEPFEEGDYKEKDYNKKEILTSDKYPIYARKEII